MGEDLLAGLRESHPDFFEEAVVELLLKMGYGGAAQRGRRIGGTNEYAQKIRSRITLIDGAKLVELMIAYRVGVQEKRKFSAVAVDEDYFAH